MIKENRTPPEITLAKTVHHTLRVHLVTTGTSFLSRTTCRVEEYSLYRLLGIFVRLFGCTRVPLSPGCLGFGSLRHSTGIVLRRVAVASLEDQS